MEAHEQLDEMLSCRLDAGRRAVKPRTVVIFGARGFGHKAAISPRP